jgi:hypothetical protein
MHVALICEENHRFRVTCWLIDPLKIQDRVNSDDTQIIHMYLRCDQYRLPKAPKKT